MSFANCAYIDANAFSHNLNRVRQLVGDKRGIVAMVKANAYGHDWHCLQAAWDDAQMLGVATMAEALQLREQGVYKPILLMSGFHTAEECHLCVQHDITVVLHDTMQLTILQQITLSQPLQVWLKLDTGMHRLGFLADEVPAAYAKLHSLQCVAKPFVVMTHLADADNNRHSEFTDEQIQQFYDLSLDFDEEKSIVNSAGIINYPDAYANWVRPGIMLYGVSPFADKQATDFKLQPVMTFTSFVNVTRRLKKGDKIGYGCTWECPQDMRVAVVGVGYGDGYPRHVARKTPVLIRGVECPIVGAISMDITVVDVTHLETVQSGDEVILWGKGLPIERIAKAANTIAYELLTQVTARVPRQLHAKS